MKACVSRIALLGIALLNYSGCGGSSGATANPDICGQFGLSSGSAGSQLDRGVDAGQVQIASIIANPTLISTDTNVRGILHRPDQVTIEKVFVAGVPAADDGSDFSSFDATIPFSVLFGKAAMVSGQLVATVEVAVITNCSPNAVVVGSGTLNLLPAPKQISYLDLSTRPTTADTASYYPTTLSYPVEIDLRANREAAGASVVLSTTMGTINGLTSATVLLSGNGVTPATATAFLAPDATKQGTAYITAQAPNDSLDASVTTVSMGINMFGPPTLVPANVTVLSGQHTQIAVIDHGVLLGCNAAPAAGLTITISGEDATTHIVYPGGVDGSSGRGVLQIDVVAASTAAGVSSTITCFDVYQQMGSATVSVPKG